MTLRLTTLICAALLVCSMPLRAQWAELHYVDPGLPWRTLETEHFLIHFTEQNRAQSRTVAAIAERVYLRTTALLDWRPRLRTHVVIMDSADFANGFATPVPFNLSGIFLSPPDEGELLQDREWLELVLSHEFFHVVHLDKASGEPLQLRRVLGRLLFAFPNVLQPTWIVEGLAVYNESDPPRRYGRLYNSYFDGMMRAEVSRGLRSLREVNAEGRGFPLNRDYLYGSYFFAFLRERYGDSAMRQFIDHYSSNIMPFRVQSNAAAVTGKEMDAVWVDYHRWLRERFAPADTMPLAGEALVRAFSVSSPVLGHDGTRWYVQADGYTRPKLMRQPAGREPSVVRATESDTRLTAAGVGVLMGEQDICRNYNLLYNLYYVDSGGARRTISQCDRHRFAAVMGAERVAAVRVDGGTAEVVVLENGKPVRSLYRTAPGESVSGIAASGERVVITALRAGVWALLDVSDGSPAVLVADEAIKHSPRFGRTPDEVFFVADYGKRYDLWSWERSTSSLARWTRAPYGVREISAPVDGELLLTTIEADGVTLRDYRLPAPRAPQRAGRASGRAAGARAGARGRRPPLFTVAIAAADGVGPAPADRRWRHCRRCRRLWHRRASGA